jgi:putative peptide maturation dehydrogenase
MPRVRRPRFLFFYCHDHGFVDVERLLEGELVSSSLRQVYGVSAARGEATPISPEDVALVLSIPSDTWVEPPADASEAVRALVEGGVLLVEDGDGELAELRRREEALAETGWNAYAALFHFLTRWRDVDLRPREPGGEPTGEIPPLTRESVERFLELRGPPPPPFHRLEQPRAVRELPLVDRDDGLFALLGRRRTTRAFDAERAVTLDELATALRYVVGVHGYAPVLGDVVTLKRTSPSGGGLHPVEAYPLVADVEGLEPGVYHYATGEHALELVEPLASAEEARALATTFMCGQTYFGSAHVFLVLAARFARNHWKYRNHHKAYPALLMDAAHLSQTLYLVATELGLGAFVTAAVNGAAVEERLGLDGYREGVVAITGFGPPAAEPSPFDPEFLPFVPRETRL